MDCSTPDLLSITNSWSLLKPMSIESVMPSNHLILCHLLLLPPSIFPNIRVFSNELYLHIRWPKYWSFSFSISPSNEYSGLISFRMAWLDLLAIQGLSKSLLQHHSSKASILQCSAFFTDQLSHPYMSTGKTIALTRQTFLPRSKQNCLRDLIRFWSPLLLLPFPVAQAAWIFISPTPLFLFIVTNGLQVAESRGHFLSFILLCLLAVFNRIDTPHSLEPLAYPHSRVPLFWLSSFPTGFLCCYSFSPWAWSGPFHLSLHHSLQGFSLLLLLLFFLWVFCGMQDAGS